MKTYEVKYPEYFKFINRYSSVNLEGTKSTSYNYSVKNGTFTVHQTPERTSAVLNDLVTGRYVTQDVYAPTGNILSSKVTVVGKRKHSCMSIQTLLKDGTYMLERSSDAKTVARYTVKPESRVFKGVKGLLERAVLFVANDRNGCERVKLAPMAHRLIMKIRHF